MESDEDKLFRHLRRSTFEEIVSEIGEKYNGMFSLDPIFYRYLMEHHSWTKDEFFDAFNKWRNPNGKT